MAENQCDKPARDHVLVPEEFFIYTGAASKTGNSLYRCQKCPPGYINKTLSCSDVTRNNLKKHIEHRHPALLASFDMACGSLHDQKVGKKKADTASEDLSGATTGETSTSWWSSGTAHAARCACSKAVILTLKKNEQRLKVYSDWQVLILQ